jgi:hypothetical protein
MTVYIVQRLHWEYDDVFYLLDSEQPVKAFVKKESAEAYRQALEAEAKENWSAGYHREFITERGPEEIPEVIYEVVPIEIDDIEDKEEKETIE